ncbi:hypothetical protein GCM10023340_20950 [Nocardioides marinquilinus]|uniref:DUF2530 domain-containing protein n=1 Tax=Nocardioides marinquilinus TaxID=1210400 RepID=A0ABP9PJW8_9ACTN
MSEPTQPLGSPGAPGAPEETAVLPEADAARPGHRHPLSIGHLVMGVAFAGLVVTWALIVGDVVEGGDIRWLLPVPWVLAGVAGLVGLIARDRRHVGTRQVGWQGEESTMGR